MYGSRTLCALATLGAHSPDLCLVAAVAILPGSEDPSAESDKTVVSICIDLNQFVCLEPTHQAQTIGMFAYGPLELRPASELIPSPLSLYPHGAWRYNIGSNGYMM
jgi:hypothetical protein